MKNTFVLLFPLRHPFTSIDVGPWDVDSDHVEVTVEVLGVECGSLKLPGFEMEEHGLMLQLFANTTREVGWITNGKVNWIINPDLTQMTQVIDAYGRVHEVSTLKEEV